MRRPNLEKRVKAIESRTGTDVVLLRFANDTSVFLPLSTRHLLGVLVRPVEFHVDPAVDKWYELFARSESDQKIQQAGRHDPGDREVYERTNPKGGQRCGLGHC